MLKPVTASHSTLWTWRRLAR